jgi:hypothetical protein
MILVWQDVQSFNRYIDYVNAYQQSCMMDERKLVKDMPKQVEIELPQSCGDTLSPHDVCELMFTVPIRKILPAKHTQN